MTARQIRKSAARPIDASGPHRCFSSKLFGNPCATAAATASTTNRLDAQGSVERGPYCRDGANIAIERDLGLTPQLAKGTGPSGRGIAVQGDLIIAPGSTIRTGRDLVGNIAVVGDADIGASSGTPRITIGRNLIGDITVRGTVRS